MDMTWDIGKTLELVEARFGRPQRLLANASIQSTNQRLRYAHFHYRQVVDELKDYRTVLGDRLAIDAAFGEDKEQQEEYYAFMERVGAHAVAGVQSIHAIADLLAASVFMSFNLSTNGKTVAEHDITFKLTLDRLTTDPKNAGVESLLKALKDDAQFMHVDALSNKAKHSSIVRPVLSEDLTGMRDERLEVQFQEFERKGVKYPQGSIADVLGPAYSLASQTVVDVGKEMLKLLSLSQ
jgi:hypothetical protein